MMTALLFFRVDKFCRNLFPPLSKTKAAKYNDCIVCCSVTIEQLSVEKKKSGFFFFLKNTIVWGWPMNWNLSGSCGTVKVVKREIFTNDLTKIFVSERLPELATTATFDARTNQINLENHFS
jgi:hypothetical protein